MKYEGKFLVRGGETINTKKVKNMNEMLLLNFHLMNKQKCL